MTDYNLDVPAPPAVPALEAVGVRKRYPDGTVALDGVDLAVAPGETVALVGESGSGKTTLLRMFNRMVEPDAGEVRFAGRPVSGLDPILLRRQVGYVPQDGGLLPHWTAAANVELVPRLLGWEPARRRARAREMLAFVGLDPDRHGARYPLEMSGGQRQRVAFARALAGDAPVVLLDEPFGALDPLTRRDLQAQFLGWKRRLGRTLVLVTHDLGEAFRLGDRVGVMRQGRLLQIAAPEELARHPEAGYVADLLARGLEEDAGAEAPRGAEATRAGGSAEGAGDRQPGSR